MNMQRPQIKLPTLSSSVAVALPLMQCMPEIDDEKVLPVCRVDLSSVQ